MNVSNPIFLETAERIGDRLCRDAIWDADECNWLGWAMTPLNQSWILAYRAQPGTVYDGTAGIALFLARLYHFTKDAILKETLLGALNRSLSSVKGIAEELKPSWFNGVTGIAYTCLEIGRILDQKALVERGLALLLDLHDTKLSERELDICVGGAGAIPVLIDVAERYSSEQMLTLAHRYGKHLVKQAVKSDEGWSWNTMPGGVSKNLLGYAHGTSGIATSLLELWSVTKEEVFKEAAMEAFRYERANFSAAHGNWPDFRLPDPPVAAPQLSPNFMMAWCHGAPGVGLSRLRAYQLLPYDETLATELQISLQTTVESFANSLSTGHGNYCLCHGSGGNADLLLNAADVLSRPELRQAAEAVGLNGIAQYHHSDVPWPGGVNAGAETPNLMLGLAGIGHYYLRLYDSMAVPSVLSITPQILTQSNKTAAHDSMKHYRAKKHRRKK